MDRVIAFRFLNFPILLLPWPSRILTRWPQFEFWLTFTFLLLAWLFNCSLHAGLLMILPALDFPHDVLPSALGGSSPSS